MSFTNATLEGQNVRLETLSESHLNGLKTAIADGALHKLTVTNVPHPDELGVFLNHANSERQANQSLVFATIDQNTNQVIGSTRFMNTNWPHLRTEIGFTFIAQSKQRTACNTEAKLLMLTHAFEEIGFNRVALRTDVLNQKSRTAIERIGAQYEGILRNHMVMPDGRIRDTVVYSIIKKDWAVCKSLFEEKLKA